MLISIVLVGCSTHPLVDDVARQSTYAIVERIRCEAILAIDKIDRENLIRKDDLISTYIGYEFQFLITENDNASASSMFRYPFTNGTLNIGLSTGAERARNSDRNFRIIESFGKVLADYHESVREGKPKCTDNNRENNWKYPIAGSIGLEEVITTYARLDKLTTLKPLRNRGGGNEGAERRGDGGQGGDGSPRRRNKWSRGQNAIPAQRRYEEDAEDDTDRGREDNEPPQTFSDKLTFTTKIAAGLKPTVTLSPVPKTFRLIEAAADIGVDRTDIHKVTIAIAVDKSRLKGDRYRYSLHSLGAPSYNPLAPSTLLDAANARGRVILELDRQRLLELGIFSGFRP
jgi:hypothetical protein